MTAQVSAVPTPRRRRFRRPSAVTLVAWLFLLQFAQLLLSGALFWPGGQLDFTVNVELSPRATSAVGTRRQRRSGSVRDT